MNKIVNAFLLVIAIAFLWALQACVSKESLSLSEKWYVNSDFKYKVLILEDAKQSLNLINVLQLGKTYVGFKEVLSFKESQGIYDIINSYGYVGNYQYAHISLNAIGITEIEKFRNN